MSREAQQVAASKARPWVKVKGSALMRCSVHDVTFKLPKTCVACDQDPAAADLEDEIDATVKAPKGCRTIEQHERWFIALANAALASAAALAKIPRNPPKKKPKAIEVVDANAPPIDLRDFHDEAAIAKHREVALKANRAAAVLAIRRTDDELVNAREKRIRDRARAAAQAGGGH